MTSTISAKPYNTADKRSFAYDTMRKRLPAILKQTIADLNEARAAQGVSAAARAEAEDIGAKLTHTLSLLGTDAPLEPLPAEDAPLVAEYNAELAALNREGPQLTWATAPWLYVECYYYRLTQLWFERSTNWRSYDMFAKQKEQTFTSSAHAVSSLADRYSAIARQIRDAKTEALRLEMLKTVLIEVIQSSLWGNATDLSFFVNLSEEEVRKLQVKAEDRAKEFLLVDDFEKIWKQLTSVAGGRVDIVLDNSGFEVYTDIILALVLLDAGLAEQIVIHPKSQPWFVSDVTPTDWLHTIQLLGDVEAFPEHRDAVNQVVARIQHYQEEGQIVLRPNTFWTGAKLFWELHADGQYGGKQIWHDLRSSKLVLFKGDLNYRKLTGDLEWPGTTPFADAISTLKSSGLAFATLRTIKSDVLVGLQAGVEEQLSRDWGKDHEDPHGWKVSGKYAVISFFK